MTKEELLIFISTELKNNPNASSLNIAKKTKVPINIVELFKRRIAMEQNQMENNRN